MRTYLHFSKLWFTYPHVDHYSAVRTEPIDTFIFYSHSNRQQNTAFAMGAVQSPSAIRQRRRPPTHTHNIIYTFTRIQSHINISWGAPSVRYRMVEISTSSIRWTQHVFIASRCAGPDHWRVLTHSLSHTYTHAHTRCNEYTQKIRYIQHKSFDASRAYMFIDLINTTNTLP